MLSLDIILLALITIFLIFKLRSLLGQNDGYQGEDQNQDMQSPLSSSEKSQKPKVPAHNDNLVNINFPSEKSNPLFKQSHPEGTVAAVIHEIQKYDPAFTIRDFIKGARSAFYTIIKAFSNKDIETLKPLLTPDVMNSFESTIKKQQQQQQKSIDEIQEFKLVDVTKASINGSIAQLEIQFVTTQISALVDKDNNIIEGSLDKAVEVRDHWVFERDVASSNPNWILVATDV